MAKLSKKLRRKFLQLFFGSFLRLLIMKFSFLSSFSVSRLLATESG